MGRGKNGLGHGKNDLGRGKNGLGRRKNHLAHRKDDLGRGKNGFGHGKDDLGRGKNDFSHHRKRFSLLTVDEKLGCYDHRREESGGGIKKAKAGLLSDIGDVSEIPRYQVIDLVKRGKRDVDRVGYIFPVKDAAGNITFGEDRNFLGKLQVF